MSEKRVARVLLATISSGDRGSTLFAIVFATYERRVEICFDLGLKLS